jgi:beta-phosphoglucomutase-like phosphatase (HAD superfamily)
MGEVVRLRPRSDRERIQAELDRLTVERSTIYRGVEEGKRKLRDIGQAIAAKYDELRRLAERARR